MSTLNSFYKSPTPEEPLHAITVLPQSSDVDHRRRSILQRIADINISSVTDVRAGKVYLFEGLSQDEIDKIRQEILQEDTHLHTFQDGKIPEEVSDPDKHICLAYQRKVTNPEIDSLRHAIKSIGIPLSENQECQTAELILLYGEISDEERAKIANEIINSSIQEELTDTQTSLRIDAHYDDTVDTIPISDLDEHELIELSSSRRLFLDKDEMLCIQEYYKQIGRDPTDCEIEVIAQAWSEHCGHKTFKSDVIINGQKKEPLYTRLKNSTAAINHPGVVSCFIDNSGVVKLDNSTGVCFKAETHSAPAAIEPFGGTETGVGGVIRDILGTGLGAKPIGVFDVIGFGELDMDAKDIPSGCLHPQTLFRETVAGVSSYGNKVGLPNISGAVFFDEGFRAKPVVLAGAIGTVPIERAEKGTPHAGDTILIIGGKTGNDGIHGATFSSGNMTDETKEVDSTAVQIGYPILKRRVMDILEVLFDQDKIHALTDVGGGGLSSAITEICEGNGGSIQLDALTTKYQGLKPWEIFLSESQERMVLALGTDDASQAIALCKHYGLDADILGTFNEGDNMLHISFDGKEVAHLDLEFVLGGNPRNTIIGEYDPPTIQPATIPTLTPKQLVETGLEILGSLKVCSRESVIRRYDHSVTGKITSPYFGGALQDTPQDALILRPDLEKDKGIIVTHGLAPEIGRYNPYSGSVTSVIEAISNAVARGADLDQMYLIDNFVHPKPDNPTDIGTLDQSLEGIVAAAQAFGTPFVSGKDSLGGTYRDQSGLEIKAPPTVIVSAVSILDDTCNTVPSFFEKSDTRIVLVGKRSDNRIAGSEFANTMHIETNDVPQYDLAEQARIFRKMQELIHSKHVISCHDIREGGAFATLAEMSMGKNIGAHISFATEEQDETASILFSEGAGCFIIEIPATSDPDELLNGIPFQEIGFTKSNAEITLEINHQTTSIPIDEIRKKYHNPLFEKVIPLAHDPQKAPKQEGHITPISTRSVSSAHPKVLVVKAPGTNSESEMAVSFEIAGTSAVIVDIADLTKQHFSAAQILAIPGGFSYGDDISAGKVFAIDLVNRFRDAIKEFLEKDKLVLGVCNGFQVLVKSGLLPSKEQEGIAANLVTNKSGSFICQNTRLRVEQSICRWTEGMSNGKLIIPMAHAEGRFIAKPDILDEIETEQQVVFRYVDTDNQLAISPPDNPNGSSNAIAGITDPTGKILGMMPHPERDPNNFKNNKPQKLIGLDVLRNGVRYFE